MRLKVEALHLETMEFLQNMWEKFGEFGEDDWYGERVSGGN